MIRLTDVTVRDHVDRLIGLLEANDGGIVIVAPYITTSLLTALLDNEHGEGNITVITSWKKQDFVAGVSSTSLWEACSARGWTLVVHHDLHPRKLHAKVYQRGHSALIGSANLTHAGLGAAPDPNHEVLVEVQVNDALRNAISEWIQSGERMTAERVAPFRELEALVAQTSMSEEVEWVLPVVEAPAIDEEHAWILSAMPPRPSIDDLEGLAGLFSHETLNVRGLRWGSIRTMLESSNDAAIEELLDRAIQRDQRMTTVIQPGGHTRCLVWRLADIINAELLAHLRPLVGKTFAELGIPEADVDKGLRGATTQLKDAVEKHIPGRLLDIIDRLKTWDASIKYDEKLRIKDPRSMVQYTWNNLPRAERSPDGVARLHLPFVMAYMNGPTRGRAVFLGYGMWEPTWEQWMTMASEFNTDASAIEALHGKDWANVLEKGSQRSFLHMKVKANGGVGHLPLGHTKRPAAMFLTPEFSQAIGTSIRSLYE